MTAPELAACLRQAGPYVNAHRGRTFVIQFGGKAVARPGFDRLIHDIALLHALGVRLVLVHGARLQIEERLGEMGEAPAYVGGLRVTGERAMAAVKQAAGEVRIGVEAMLSMGLANSPMHGARLRVASGNFVTARPLGVRDGVDHGFTGEVRRVDAAAIRAQFEAGALVLLSPLGYSPTGEVFNLSAEEVAVAAAEALRADKLILLSHGPGPRDAAGRMVRELSLSDCERLDRSDLGPDVQRHLDYAVRACRAGVRRIHLLDREVDGALLAELYTRDGVGTLITTDVYEGVRGASIEDVGGVLELLAPLEADGTLVRRSRERLETEIGHFAVIERDGAVIGCAALYPSPDEAAGELACLAVHPAYRAGGRAASLLRFIEREARAQALERIFVLTTRAAHWFQERGFEAADIDALPVQRMALYNLQRRSKVFVKAL